MFSHITQFANPELLWLLVVIPVMIAWRIWRGSRSETALRHSSIDVFAKHPRGWRVRLRHGTFAMRMVSCALIIIAVARPQSSAGGENVWREGIDITMVLDISGSMLAEDFKPNRLEAAKNVAEEFIRGREHDRIGLVIFAGESFTQSPLTTDFNVLIDLLHKVKANYLVDGTAVGEGIANAVNRMRTSVAKSRVMILLTDGVNNRGAIDPVTAANIAADYGIRIYTIGVGTRGVAPYPLQTTVGTVYQQMPVEIDEDMLREVARIGGGEYFRATNNQKLREIYQSIDRMEKTRIEVQEYRRHSELYRPFVTAGLGLLVLEILLAGFVFRKIP
jgi:Ca-activated chloride channel family protein